MLHQAPARARPNTTITTTGGTKPLIPAFFACHPPPRQRAPYRGLPPPHSVQLITNPVAERKFTRVETRFPTLALDDCWSYPARYVATEHESSTIREELGRGPSSSGFTRTSACHDSSCFVVERHLEGRDEEIKESLIGVEVFRRKPDYQTKLDSVVRTEAARLRARLAEYYRREGGPERGGSLIEIPKGGYLPAFRYPQTARQPNAPWLRRSVARRGSDCCCSDRLVESSGADLRPFGLPRYRSKCSGNLMVWSKDSVDGLTDELISSLSVIEGMVRPLVNVIVCC